MISHCSKEKNCTIQALFIEVFFPFDVETIMNLNNKSSEFPLCIIC